MPTSTPRLWPELAVVEIDLDDLGVGGQALAVAQAEVERRADDQDHVGLGQGLAPGAVRTVAGGPAATSRGPSR